MRLRLSGIGRSQYASGHPSRLSGTEKAGKSYQLRTGPLWKDKPTMTNDTTQDKAEEIEDRWQRQHKIEMHAAPECHPSILSAAPHLYTAGDGTRMLELVGGTPPEPDDDVQEFAWPVVERVDIASLGLTVVAAQWSGARAVFVMPTPESEEAAGDR
jgi:hypothetical protein